MEIWVVHFDWVRGRAKIWDPQIFTQSASVFAPSIPPSSGRSGQLGKMAGIRLLERDSKLHGHLLILSTSPTLGPILGTFLGGQVDKIDHRPSARAKLSVTGSRESLACRGAERRPRFHVRRPGARPLASDAKTAVTREREGLGTWDRVPRKGLGELYNISGDRTPGTSFGLQICPKLCGGS